ncbi:MAG: glutamate formiminotransferase [Acidimicrobiales bacterium]
MPLLECVVNVSEGRDRAVIDALAAATNGYLLDIHSDPDHHRSVLTLAGDGGLEEAVRRLATEAVRRIDLSRHRGSHPRLGAVDVVPFVPLAGADLAGAVAARNRFAAWAAATLAVPCFLYGPERSLPDVRRQAFANLPPDTGPSVPHPTAGAACVGARRLLVAYNVWLSGDAPVEQAREIARDLRGPGVRALGLDVGGAAQVSLNLVDPARFGPAEAYDAVASRAPVDRAELVGLLPALVLEGIPQPRWELLDLDPARTIEARLGRLERPEGPVRPTLRDGGPASADGADGGAPAR